MSTLTSPLDRLRELGGELFLAGEHIRYRIPAASAEARSIIAELRQSRDAVRQLLQDQASKPPSREEVEAALPPGVRLLRYQPKVAPFTVAPVSVVTNAGAFYRTYLRDLKARLETPEGWCCPPLADILGKLADAGLELQIERGEAQ